MPVIDTLERTLNVEMRDADRRQSNQMLKYMDQQANPLGVEYEVIIMEESRSTEDLLEGFVENYSPDLFLIGSRPDRSKSVDSIARQFTIGQPLDVDADDNYGLDSGNGAGVDVNSQLDMVDDEQELSPMRKWLFSHSLTQYLVDNLQCAVLVVKWENQH
ncbi:hypothetical protein MP228_000910 [Amoeboaphelidium protococcarum]|nr:hypothetical protein MP228_000910 [Amoeboaphelidium protococcarum]